MRKTDVAVFTTIWLIVITAGFFYLKYYYNLKTVGEIIVSMTPAIAFFTAAIIIYARDKEKIYQAKRHEESQITIKLSLTQALIHDLIIYLIPAIIIFTPIFFGSFPGMHTFAQAIIVFSALAYLKMLYWKEL